MAKKSIYVSIDIEADGPIPGINSMLNFGAAAFDLESEDPLTPIATFETNIEPLPNAVSDPDTMNFWGRNQEAFAYITKDPTPADEAMAKFDAWSRELPGRPVMVVFPTYDFMWLRWYLVRFLGTEKAGLYGFAAVDMKSLAWGVLNDLDFRGISKRNMSKRRRGWFKGHPPHDHTGLSDAIGQGMLFVSILQEIRS